MFSNTCISYTYTVRKNNFKNGHLWKMSNEMDCILEK